MNETERLIFISDWSPAELNSLWQNCFAGAANSEREQVCTLPRV
jgi:hypothetical protein